MISSVRPSAKYSFAGSPWFTSGRTAMVKPVRPGRVHHQAAAMATSTRAATAPAVQRIRLGRAVRSGGPSGMSEAGSAASRCRTTGRYPPFGRSIIQGSWLPSAWVVLFQPGPQPDGLRADDRVELRVVVCLPPEHLVGDHRFLELAVPALQVPLDEKSKKPGQPFVSSKAGARQHALQRLTNRVLPDGVGFHGFGKNTLISASFTGVQPRFNPFVPFRRPAGSPFLTATGTAPVSRKRAYGQNNSRPTEGRTWCLRVGAHRVRGRVWSGNRPSPSPTAPGAESPAAYRIRGRGVGQARSPARRRGRDHSRRAARRDHDAYRGVREDSSSAAIRRA